MLVHQGRASLRGVLLLPQRLPVLHQLFVLWLQQMPIRGRVTLPAPGKTGATCDTGIGTPQNGLSFLLLSLTQGSIRISKSTHPRTVRPDRIQRAARCEPALFYDPELNWSENILRSEPSIDWVSPRRLREGAPNTPPFPAFSLLCCSSGRPSFRLRPFGRSTRSEWDVNLMRGFLFRFPTKQP